VSHATGPIRRRWWLPLAGSFAVYLTPLVGPHAVPLLGEAIRHALTRHDPSVTAAWTAADVGAALLFQLLFGLVLLWIVRGHPARWLALVALVPAGAVAIDYTYLVALPSYFLIEADRTPERQDLVERCAVPGAMLIQLRTPASLPAQAFDAAWAQRSDGRYVLVRARGCDALDPRVPVATVQPGGRVDFMLAPIFAVRGATVFERSEVPSGRRSWWRLSGDGERFDVLPVPDGQQAGPILSDQGGRVAWLEPVPGEPPIAYRVHIRSLAAAPADTIVDLGALPRQSWVLDEYDEAAGIVTLWGDGRPTSVDLTGRAVLEPAAVPQIRPQVTTFQGTADAWLAWDAYRDAGPYWLAWRTPTGAGRSRVPLGRAVTSAALDPSGRFIAVSTTTSLSIGGLQDTVYVMRTDDGGEVFRRYLPTYTRSAVAFFEGGSFAYSDLQGTHVLELPR
jgi:hypothetical protein